MRQLHVGRVVAQPGERVVAHGVPIEIVVPLAEQRVPHAAIQLHGFAEQAVIDQTRRAAVRGDDADLESAIHHAAFDLVDRAHMQLQMHIGRKRVERADGVPDACGRVARRLVEHRHRQLPAHARVNVVDAVAKTAHGRQQPQCLLVHALAFGGERKTRAPTAAEREAQPHLQILHMAAHRAGADVQLQFRRRHAAAIDHRLEHLQQAQIHVADLAQHGAVARGLRRLFGAGFAGGSRAFGGRFGSGFFYLHKSSSKQ